MKQSERSTANDFGVNATPSALTIGVSGLVEAGVAEGEPAITALLNAYRPALGKSPDTAAVA